MTTTKARPAKSSGEKFDLNQVVTDQFLTILAEMEENAKAGIPVKNWLAPYTQNGVPKSMSTGKAYRGINPLILAFTAIAKGYTSNWWGTYNQITERGGQVRKGEKTTMIVLWSVKESKTKIDPKTGRPERYYFLRYFRVLNAEQADWENGLPKKFAPIENDEEFSPIDEAEQIVERYLSNGGPNYIRTDQNVAYYQPGTDTVNVPLNGNLKGTHEYYSTLFHELGHSTGHAKRLNRDGITQLISHKRGKLYSFEELVAEMSAGILCGHAGIDDTLENSAAYLRHWMSFLKDDNKAIIKAAGKAQAAVDLILGTTFEKDTEEEI